MREQTRTLKEVEEKIRRAIWTDRKLPKVGLSYPKSPVGKMMAIDDTQRSLEDIMEDIPFRERPTKEDIENWHVVMFVWLPALEPISREIVVRRCSGMGWKRIIRVIIDKKISDRILSRTTLWRIFKDALEEILIKNETLKHSETL